jgi:hypothetical protein
LNGKSVTYATVERAKITNHDFRREKLSILATSFLVIAVDKAPQSVRKVDRSSIVLVLTMPGMVIVDVVGWRQEGWIHGLGYAQN